jgi:hypothetical protein
VKMSMYLSHYSCNASHWGGGLLDVVPNLTLSLRRGCTGRMAKQALTGFDPDISKSYHQTVFLVQQAGQ